MVQINFAQKQINAKVVYYGPGMSGKTTNLEVIHQRAPAPNRGDLTSISTDGDRTLFFDYMPLDLGTVAGMRTCFQIYTVPGQVYYNSTRKLVLQGVDGVIFVADSSEKMREQNIESLKNLEENLAEYGKGVASLPLVLQYNKRDLPDAMSVERLEADLNAYGVPSFEAVANTGQGVFPTLKALAAVVLKNLSQENSMGASGPRPAARPAPAGAPAAPPAPVAARPAQHVPAHAGQTGFVPQQQHGGAPGGQTSFAPRPAAHAPLQMQGGHQQHAVSIPLSDTGMTPRNTAMPHAHQPAPPFAGQQHAAHAAPAQHPQVATNPAAQARPKAMPNVAGAARPQSNPAHRRVAAKSQPEAEPARRGGMLYTGAFIVLATAVGAVLARAILSVLS